MWPATAALPRCDQACVASMARTVCAHLLLAPKDDESPTYMMMTQHFEALLRPRAKQLINEFECTLQNQSVHAPKLKHFKVENGKSSSTFLLGGGPHVVIGKPATYGAIFKQLNSQETALLPSFLPNLTSHQRYNIGTFMAPFLGWVRHISPDGVNFDAILMENMLRPPPGARLADDHRSTSAQTNGEIGVRHLFNIYGGWKPYDLKGIRLYAHERRFSTIFGSRGLRVSSEAYKRMSLALKSDVTFLRAHQLVDYSYLLSVVGVSTAPATSARVACRDAVSARSSLEPRLIHACFCPINVTMPSVDTGDLGNDRHVNKKVSVDHSGGISTQRDRGGMSQERSEDAIFDHHSDDKCYTVMVRVALIDYLREWKFIERAEHLRKTITRDVLAFERNHAVIPVAKFADSFVAYFSEVLFSPLPLSEVPSLRKFCIGARGAAFALLERVARKTAFRESAKSV